MLLFSALVAGSFALGSLVANDIAPLALNAVRFWIAAVLIGILAWRSGGLRLANYRAPWRYCVLAAIYMIYFVLMFEGLKTAPALNVAAVFTLTPLLTAAFAFVILRQTLTARMALALAIGGVGAVWVIFRADIAALLSFDLGRGELIYFVGCVCHAAYTPLVRKLNRGEAVLPFTFGVLLAGAMMLTIVGWRDLVATPWGELSALVWGSIVYVAIFASAATFVLLQFASMRLPSAKVMAYTYLIPTWVMLWTLALGAQVPPLPIVFGVLFTIVALALLLRDDE